MSDEALPLHRESAEREANVTCPDRRLPSTEGFPLITMENLKYVLHRDRIVEYLEDDRLANKRVVVISMTGKNRLGKTLLLNMFVLYAHYTYEMLMSPGSWLSAVDTTGMKSFKWEKKKKKPAQVLMLPIFFEHEDKVILFFDTEGLTNISSGIGGAHGHLALTSMLSSVQIFVVRSQVNDYDLEGLQSATTYGDIIGKNSGISGHNMMLTVTDWIATTDYPYGSKGGHLYCESLFHPEQKIADKKAKMLTHLDAHFKKIEAFLLPNMGLEAAYYKGDDLKGQINLMKADFKKLIEQFAQEVLAPENLIVKRIRDREITVRELFTFAEQFVRELNDINILTIQNDYTTMMTVNILTAKELAYRKYIERIVKIVYGSKYIGKKFVSTTHDEAMAEALMAFDQVSKIFDEQVFSEHREDLKRDLTCLHQNYVDGRGLSWWKLISCSCNSHDWLMSCWVFPVGFTCSYYCLRAASKLRYLMIATGNVRLFLLILAISFIIYTVFVGYPDTS